MEATGLLALPLILFLSFTANGVSASRGISNIVAQPPAVIDCLGDVVVSGKDYYLDPKIDDLPPYYTPAIVPGVFRPQTVWLQYEIEELKYWITGPPVQFSPVQPTEDTTIYESTDLNIKYTDELAPVSGGTSSVWTLGQGVDEFVSLGGVEENSSSWFKIEKVNDRVYKLVSSVSSKDIELSRRLEGAKRLAAVDDQAIAFEFCPQAGQRGASK